MSRRDLPRPGRLIATAMIALLAFILAACRDAPPPLPLVGKAPATVDRVLRGTLSLGAAPLRFLNELGRHDPLPPEVIATLDAGHRDAVLPTRAPVAAIAVSLDGKRMIIGQADDAGTVQVYDFADHEWTLGINAHRGPVSDVNLTRVDDVIVTAGSDFQVHVWDGKTGQRLRSFFGLGPVAVEPMGRNLACLGHGPQPGGDEALRFVVWDIASERVLRDVAIDPQGDMLGDAVAAMVKYDWQMSSDRRKLVGCGPMGALVVDLATGKTTPLPITGIPQRVAVNDHATRVAVAGIGYQPRTGQPAAIVQLFNAADAKPLRRIVIDDAQIEGLCFSPDGRTLAVWTCEAIHIINTENARRLHRFASPVDAPVTAATFTPTAKRLLTGHATGHIVLWDLSRSPAEKVVSRR